MGSYEYRTPLELDIADTELRLENGRRITIGNTGFWATLSKDTNTTNLDNSAWMLNYTPENNRDGNVDADKKVLYRNLFLVSLARFWEKIEDEDTSKILVAPHTNYVFFRFLQKIVQVFSPESELNHTVLNSKDLQNTEHSLEARFQKHRYEIDLAGLFSSAEFQKQLRDAKAYIQEKLDQKFKLTFEIED